MTPSAVCRVIAAEVFAMASLVAQAANLTRARELPEPEASIRTALQTAILSSDDALADSQREWLVVLRR